MKSNIVKFLFLSIALIFIVSCEESYIPEDVQAKNEYVVEGHIELSSIDLPAYVILSKSISYFSTFDTATFKSLYIDDADVSVFDGVKTVDFQHVCAIDLNPSLILKMYSEVGHKIFNPDFCAYLDLNNELKKEAGRHYKLTIEHDNNIVTSTTSITQRVELDSINFKSPPGEFVDSLALLWGTLDDPGEKSNYYRYFVRENFFNVYNFNSIFDDYVINGQEIEMPFQKPSNPRNPDFDSDTDFLYNRGDTIQFKFCTIDQEHFDFWESFQFSNTQGPFSSYIRANDNIDGGIGIWGGYNCQVVDLIVPME